MQDLTTQPIRDFVFPVGNLRDQKYVLNGTAFFIGGNGFAVTAGHVIADLQAGGAPLALFAKDGQFVPIPIIATERHPDEDIGIIKLQGDWHSIIEVSTMAEYSSCEYELWGYPERVAHEIRALADNAQDAAHAIKPDLIYNRGYVRRRITQRMPVSVYSGECFYELSEVAGSCCSGAPLIKRRRTRGPWQAFGVYIGEETASGHTSVGYGSRLDAVASWTPSLLGVPLAEVKATVRQ